MRLTDKNAMQYYLTETAANNWSVRTLGSFLRLQQPDQRDHREQRYQHWGLGFLLL
jgi:predicted nuclease of restriction endonuclease-like (RecB) superfamily